MRKISKKSISTFTQYYMLALIAVFSFLPVIGSALYLPAVMLAIFLMTVSSPSSVFAALCVGGLPFFIYIRSELGISVTQLIIALTLIELLWLASRLGSSGTPARLKNGVGVYAIWLTALLLFILISYLYASQSAYNVYYVQYLFVYSIFASCSAIIVVIDNVLKQRLSYTLNHTTMYLSGC